MAKIRNAKSDAGGGPETRLQLGVPLCQPTLCCSTCGCVKQEVLKKQNYARGLTNKGGHHLLLLHKQDVYIVQISLSGATNGIHIRACTAQV